jgi:uncharacterized membrane protein YphA (DoxX/SURF4 family)
MNRYDIVLFGLVLAFVSFVTVIFLSGCTAAAHKTKCYCECKEKSAIFECGGNIHKEEMEVP